MSEASRLKATCLKAAHPWQCTREVGHKGPCAVEFSEPYKPLPETANDRQVGGSHYKQKDGGEQHWDRIARIYGDKAYVYFVGCITKYVERYRNKNGVEDLKKARHYLDKLIELESETERESI